MENIKIFYFDIDGTILNNDNNEVSINTINALHALQEKGYKVVMATGRTLGAIKDTEFLSSINWDAYILGNGGIVLDKEFNTLLHNPIEDSFIEDLKNNYDGTILLEGDDLFIINDVSDNIKDLLSMSAVDMFNNEYTGAKIQKIIIEHINKFEDGFNNPIFDNYTYTVNNLNLYEIFPKDSGKDVAINLINEKFDSQHFAYFGDGNNDIEAIEKATLGIAMGNAVDNAKKVADYVTDNVGDDGIFKAIKYFNFI